MSETFHPRYIRPKSRSEELARYAKAEKNIAEMLGELPRSQTIFERIKGRVVEKVRPKQDTK